MGGAREVEIAMDGRVTGRWLARGLAVFDDKAQHAMYKFNEEVILVYGPLPGQIHACLAGSNSLCGGEKLWKIFCQLAPFDFCDGVSR